MGRFKSQVCPLRRIALSFLALLILAQGMADGFVLYKNPNGLISFELEANDCHESRHPKGVSPVTIHEVDLSVRFCLDISFFEEFPPLPSTVESPLFLDLTHIGYPSLLTLNPLSIRQALHRGDMPQGRSPLGPDPLATVRLIL